MRRLVLLIACLAASAANTCLAADPAACMSACTTEQRQCQGGAKPKQERLMAPSGADKGLAEPGAQVGKLRGASVFTIDSSTTSFKRLARGSACEAGYEQCTRDCGQAQGAGAAGKDNQAAKQAG